MTEQEIKIVVHQINDYLSEQLWMDFEIAEYSKYVMRIIGCLDFSGQPNLEIIFHDVFFASAVFATSLAAFFAVSAASFMASAAVSAADDAASFTASTADAAAFSAFSKSSAT